MLLTVEGGGFFFASASGYSKFLSLILLNQRNEERPTRVLPWNHYHLVEQEADIDIQLTPTKKHASHKCSFFICFRRPSTGPDGTSPPKLGPIHSECVTASSVSEKGRDSTRGDEAALEILLRGSLKKQPSECLLVVGVGNAEEALGEMSDMTGNIGRRKIQWTDVCGGELVEIREFEPSELSASDEESEKEGHKRCECTIQ